MKTYLDDVLHLINDVLRSIERNKGLFVLVFICSMIAIALGMPVADGIENATAEQNEIYTKALHTNSADGFNYIIDTKAGNVFSVMEMTADHPVTNQMIDGEYMYIKSVREEYTMHTRIVTYTDSDGNEQTEIETYWTWDYAGSKETFSDTVTVNNRAYPFNNFCYLPKVFKGYHYVGSDVRYYFNVTPVALEGALYVEVDDNGIVGQMRVFDGMGVDQAYESCLQNPTAGIVLFYVLWVGVVLSAVGMAYKEFEQ